VIEIVPQQIVDADGGSEAEGSGVQIVSDKARDILNMVSWTASCDGNVGVGFVPRVQAQSGAIGSTWRMTRTMSSWRRTMRIFVRHLLNWRGCKAGRSRRERQGQAELACRSGAVSISAGPGDEGIDDLNAAARRWVRFGCTVMTLSFLALSPIPD